MIFFRSRVVLGIFIRLISTWLPAESNEFISLISSRNDDFCITNSSSAMYFITADNEVVEEESSFLPQIEYLCDSEKVKCQDYLSNITWHKAYSSNHDETPILDVRWESLPIKELDYKTSADELIFTTLGIIKKANQFKKIISLRGKEAHLLLCDEEKVKNANCYWFVLQGWNNNVTALRRCESGQIKGLYPKGDCSKRKKEKNHPEFPLYMDENSWSHIILEKENTNLYLKIYKDGKEETIIHYSETNEMFAPKYLLGHRKEGKVYCKVHENHYMHTTIVSVEVFDKWFPKVDHGFCISLLVSTCPVCSIRILFEYGEERERFNKTILPTNGTWVHHKIVMDNADIPYMKVKIETMLNHGMDKTENEFWSFDNLRDCHKEEYRITQKNSKKFSECRLLTNNQKVNNEEVMDYVPDSSCLSTDSIGRPCITCSILEQRPGLQCENLKICEDVKDSNTCYCSPGYNGTECNIECPGGTYGYSCGKQCGFCSESGKCNAKTGSCTCNRFFEGSTCDTPINGQYLRNAPKVVNITPDSCEIKWNFTDWIGKREPKYYQIQYMQESTHNNPRWMDYGTDEEIEKYNTAVIKNLDASKKYKIRVLIGDEKYTIKNLNSQNLPFRICETTCNDWKEDDIVINTTSTSVTIQLNVTKDKCDVKLYNYELKNKEGEVIHSGNASKRIIIPSLKIYTNYTFKFFFLSKSITRQFTTQGAAPSEVREIEVEKSTASYIQLRWKEPELANGVIEKYKIVYRKIRRISCTKNSTENPAEMNTTDKSIQLNNLEPYSVYGVAIFAFNRFYSSKQSTVKLMETLGLNHFEKDENLENIKITVETSERSASIEFKDVQCNKLQGPLIFSIQYRCISIWCSNTENHSEISFEESKRLNGLQPYSEYKFDIFFCRNETKTNCEINEKYNNRTFRTKFSVPNELTDFSVIAAGHTFISLRWLPPYPPTGTIGKYKITTRCTSCQYGRENTNEIVLAENCAIWPEYKCYKITEGIEPGSKYSMEIYACNKENSKYHRIAYQQDISVLETTPEKPYNLSVIWNLNNTMELFWIHPNKTNGILNKFNIQVTPSHGAQINLPYIVYEEKLTYHCRISSPLPSAVDLIIRITTKNNLYESEAAEIYDSSYPAKPDLTMSQISITNYTETTISLSLDLTQVVVSNSLDEQFAFVLIDDSASDVKDPNLKVLEERMNSTFDAKSRLRFVVVFDLKNQSTTIINFKIGDGKDESVNKPLRKATYYNITIIIFNGYKKKYRHTSHEVRGLTEGNPEMTPSPPERKKGEDEDNSGGNAAYALLLLLLLIPIIIVVVIKRKHIVFVRPTISLEKILESSSRMLPSGKEADENILLDTKETVVISNKPVMKVKPKLSIRKSTNPPNVPTSLYSKPVVMADFEEYVKTSIESGELERQHALFPRGQTQSWQYGSTKVNKPKNRYNNLVAYDHSRVILEKLAGDENSDYINANYIHGYNIERAYIATQGPKPTTLTDFWRMIWQENVRHIVMLANILEGGKKKVEQYWPNINEELTFQDIIVQYQSMEIFANFEYRIFHAMRGDETRKISQLHFTTWPDHGVPLYPQSLVPFLRKLLKVQLSSSSPIVVHCSAGVGGTGTVILADMSLRMAAKQGVVDMLNNIQKLREQRPNMVDNVEQYKLAHLVVLEYLMGLRTSIPCNEDLDKAVQKLIKDEDYRIQMNYLEETEWQDQAMKSVAECNEEFPNYTEKNRIQEILPESQGRIFLTRYPHDDESSSYINAVQVDGFRSPGRYFVTQQPMPNTLGDFWRFVTERKINVILSLNEIDLRERTCCKFWPTADDPELQPVDFVLLKFGKVTELEYYNIYSLHVWIKNKREKEKLNVEIVAFKGWRAKAALPSCCEEFLSFYEEADAISRRSTNVIVTCFDGATACGVYVALSFLIEQMKLEHECDVCLAVRSVRHNRKQFITDENQFLFLYECAVKFINGFQSYANFQNQ